MTTLDGFPASYRYIEDQGKRFVIVYRKDGKGGNVEFSFSCADRILASHGRFKS